MAYYSRISTELDCKELDTLRRAIIPFYKGGAFRISKDMDLALNRAYQRFGHAKIMQQFVNRELNNSGTSRLYGARESPGFLLDHLFIPLLDAQGCFLLDNTI